MKSKVDRATFFGPSSSHTVTKMGSDAEQDHQRTEAAFLKHTAAESYHYVHDLVSVEQAKKDPLPKLEKFIMDPDTIKTTHNLLTHLELVKGIVLPSYTHLANSHQAERMFLPAYMIVAKSEFIFESPTDIDERLLNRAEEMLQSFEALCAFMGTIYINEDSTTASPLAASTPSADRVFANLNDKRTKNEHLFRTEGRVYLEKFHQKQVDYYQIFTEWEVNNRHKLAKILIAKYLDIETYRFKALNSLDPRMLELYEGYGKQQETLKRRVHFLLGEPGSDKLTEELNKRQAILEENKWVTSPAEALLHELALNPDSAVAAQLFKINPKKDLNTAITALTQTPPSTDLLLDVFEEIRDELIRFTPHNARQTARLQYYFNRMSMSNGIETSGLHEGLYKITSSLIKEIRPLASPARAQEIKLFLEQMNRINIQEGSVELLKQALDFIYHKLSQTNFEVNRFHAQNIVPYEESKFQERLSKKQFNLDVTLNWIDKFISTPQNYRLDQSQLCSKYVGSYVAQSLLINTLQQPEHSVLRTIPETFYLDRSRIVRWHTQYQHLLHTVSALSYMEEYCLQQGIKLTPEELLQEKNRLLQLLNTEALSTPKGKADDLVAAINRLLKKENQECSLLDKNITASWIESCCSGANKITPVINKRLGDYLSYYSFKGHAPQNPVLLVSKYDLTTELNHLGQEMVPVMRIHSKVHGAFYQQQVEHRLWKPLFDALKPTVMPKALLGLLAAEQEHLSDTHAYLDKFVFVLGGLALIQQTVTYSDSWNLNLTIKNSELKRLADSFGLVEMIHAPRATKDSIEHKLMELMQHVADEYEVPYEASQQNKIAHMLHLAKEGKSPVRSSFMDGVISISKKSIIKSNEELNRTSLIEEFKEETTYITTRIKEHIKATKEALLPDDVAPEAEIIPSMRTGNDKLHM
ncbi:MAG: TCP11-related protein [Legionella sp.]|nr:TCP11-related protein [Legionella sp.]